MNYLLQQELGLWITGPLFDMKEAGSVVLVELLCWDTGQCMTEQTCVLDRHVHPADHMTSLTPLVMGTQVASHVTAGRLFQQLVDLFQFYMTFPINDHTGEPRSDEDVTSLHYEKVQPLVSLAYALA